MPCAPSVARRLRARRRRRDDQKLLAALLESVDLAIVTWSRDGGVTHVSRCARELLGADCPCAGDREAWISELRPRTPSGIAMLREDLPPLRALQGETVRGVDVLVCVRGGEALLSVSARPVEDEGGRVCGALALLEDVTERRRDEARLRARLHGAGRSRMLRSPGTR
jgi:PAS domain S-box-containing protein